MRAALWSLRLALAAVLLGMTANAGATVTIALEWGECGSGTGGCTATGTDTISVNAGGGQTLRLDIFMTHDLTQGLKRHSVSLNFDSAIENELNLGSMVPSEWFGIDVDPSPFVIEMYGPFSGPGAQSKVESAGPPAGRINSFESGAILGVLPPNGVAYTVGTFSATAPARYRIGQAYFTTNGATTDGADVFSGLFNTVIDLDDGFVTDRFVDANGIQISPETILFGTATLNLIPEPGTASLLGLGLVGLVLASRGRRT
jgi:hypothetical protein